MKVTIIDQPIHKKLIGNSTTHASAKSYGEEIIALLDTVWPVIRAQQISTSGLNHVIYETNDQLFAGVEANNDASVSLALKSKELILPRYAYFKHSGPYAKLPLSHANMDAELSVLREESTYPKIEIYGHWTDDEAKLETEIIYALK